MTPTPQSPEKEYRITESELEEWEAGGMCWSEEKDLHAAIRSRSIPQDLAPSIERIGSIRTPILQEDAYLIERVNAGMGEWEYVIQYCGEYYATAPSEEIARSIVEMAQHTCPIFTPMHDATIRREAYEQGVKDTKKEHREYEKCHKHFACPDGEECWYASADYYWDCGNGAAKLSEAFSRGKEQGAREERERVLNKAWIRIETVAPDEGIHSGWVLISEVKATIKSLRSSKEK